jgi:hypothetical protein
MAGDRFGVAGLRILPETVFFAFTPKHATMLPDMAEEPFTLHAYVLSNNYKFLFRFRRE